jgi:hypothetical protein
MQTCEGLHPRRSLGILLIEVHPWANCSAKVSPKDSLTNLRSSNQYLTIGFARAWRKASLLKITMWKNKTRAALEDLQ